MTAPSPTVFLIVGLPRHGKTTAREFLSPHLDQRGASTSELGYELLAEERGVTVADLNALPKESLRQELVRVCDAALDQDSGAFARHFLARGVTIIDGIRRRSELLAAKSMLLDQGQTTRIIWIENPRVPLVRDNTDITPADADTVVFNDGTLADLRDRLAAVTEPSFDAHRMVRLYRGATPGASIVAPDALPHPLGDWRNEVPGFVNSHRAQGRWFGDSAEQAQWYCDFDKLPGEPRGTISFVDLPFGVAEGYRLANRRQLPDGVETAENPRAFSARPGEEYFLHHSLAACAQPLPALPSWLNEQSLTAFAETMRQRFFDEDQGVWLDERDYGQCTLLNAAPAKALRAEGWDVEICGVEFGTPAMQNDALAGGHDWLVIRNGSFEAIIDPWRCAYLGATSAITVDPSEVSRWYGNRAAWKSVSGVNTFANGEWFGLHASRETGDWSEFRSMQLRKSPCGGEAALCALDEAVHARLGPSSDVVDSVIGRLATPRPQLKVS